MSSEFRLTFNTEKNDGTKPDLDQLAAAKLLLDETTSKTPSMVPAGTDRHLKALIIVTSNSDFGELTKLNGRQTGAFLAEAAKPIAAAIKGGMDLDVASPKGGAVPLDPVGVNWRIIFPGPSLTQLRAIVLPARSQSGPA